MPGNDASLRKPIIIIGAGRSGMSFLGELLMQYEHLAVVEEPRMIWRYGNDAKSDMFRAADARPKVVRYIHDSFAKMLRERGKRRLVDITPGNALRLEFVDRVFPDCRFVHMIRHGVNNVLGMRRFYAATARRLIFYHGKEDGLPRKLRHTGVARRLRQAHPRQVRHYAMEVIRRTIPEALLPLVGPPVVGARLPGMVKMRKEMDLLELCFWQWRACVESACHAGRQLGDDRYMECRLENLTPDVVRSILEFCELDDNPAVFEYLQSQLDRSRLRETLDDADPDEVRRLERWVEPTMRWLEATGLGLESDRRAAT